MRSHDRASAEEEQLWTPPRRRSRPTSARCLVCTLLLGAACYTNPPVGPQPSVAAEPASAEAEPARQEPEPALHKPEPARHKAEPTPESIAAPSEPPVCEPLAYGDCPAGTSGRSVPDVMKEQPKGSIVVEGVAVTGQTACTRSEPPHCTTFLALADQVDRPTHELSIRGQVGKPGFMCSEGSEACCTLALDGTRYAVTGRLERRELVVASLCRIVD